MVSVHAPNNEQTRHLVNAERLALLRDGAIFINTSRGPLVDQEALVAELHQRRIWAFLDVTDPEPPPPDSPLIGCPHLPLSPHVAGRSPARCGTSCAGCSTTWRGCSPANRCTIVRPGPWWR